MRFPLLLPRRLRNWDHCMLTQVWDVWSLGFFSLLSWVWVFRHWVIGSARWLLGWGPLGKERGDSDSEGEWEGKTQMEEEIKKMPAAGWLILSGINHSLLFCTIFLPWFWFKAKISQTFQTCLQSKQLRDVRRPKLHQTGGRKKTQNTQPTSGQKHLHPQPEGKN